MKRHLKRVISSPWIILIFVLCFLLRYITVKDATHIPLKADVAQGKRVAAGVYEVNCKRFYQNCSNAERQAFVKDAFKFAWKNYHKYAWGHDHLKPTSRSYDDDLLGLGATLVDSLTTLKLMGLDEFYNISREWIKNSFILSKSLKHDASLFEVCIRLIGGLTSTYHLTDDPMYLEKAKEVADRALSCFQLTSNIPHMKLNMRRGTCIPSYEQRCLYQTCNPNPTRCTFKYCLSEIAEVGTLGLEFRALSYASGDMKYAEAVNRTANELLSFRTWDGLVSRRFYVKEKLFVQSSDVGTGPGTDSYYEYLLKQWIQSNFKAERFRVAYIEAMSGIKKHLMANVRVRNKRMPILGQRTNNVTLNTELHHLSCFLPGTLALGVYYGMPESHMDLAKDILDACYYLYESQPTGLAAEVSRFTNEGVTPVLTENFLRPETVESLFILWRVTKQQKYREMGWNIFQAFERTSRTCAGYTNIQHVGLLSSRPLDKMESFYLAETLTYFYLLFEDDDSVFSFDDWVYNTEAHPLPILKTYPGWY